MDNLVGEVEIKIEYNESFERDPLCDNNINSSETSESNISIGKGCASDESNNFQTCRINVGPEKSRFSLQSYNNYSENSTTVQETWYDSIDITGRFHCKFCDLKYSTLQTLRVHVKSKHPDQAAHIKENLVKYKRNSKFTCHVCKQGFKDILELKSHVANMHSLENIKTSCVFCDAMFSSKNEMSEHLFVQHKKVISKCTYMCNICGYRTFTKSHYNQHKNTHVGDKTEKCQYCDYATNYLPNLKSHERIHTKDKMYVCDFINCKYRCTAKSALRSHQLKHNSKHNELYCDKCSYKTIYKQSLKRHINCHQRNSVKLKPF